MHPAVGQRELGGLLALNVPSRTSVQLDQPAPNAAAARLKELYIRVTRSDAQPPANARSVSGSTKLPVAVLTGSSE